VALKATGLPSLPGLLVFLAGRSRRISRRPQGRVETAALTSVCRLCRAVSASLTLSIPGVPARLPTVIPATAPTAVWPESEMKIAGTCPVGSRNAPDWNDK